MKWSQACTMKEPANTVTHLIPFIAGFVGFIYLLLEFAGEPAKQITGGIFGISIIMLYGASTAYHWIRTTPAKVRVLRKLDHIAIFLLIAGTYTPVFYFGLEGWWRWTMLTAVYAIAGIGILMKVFFLQVPRYISTIFYIALGWIAVIPITRMADVFTVEVFIYMVLGGLSYTIGGVIYATKICDFLPNRFGFHEVFHIFVALGTLCHYIMIAGYILPVVG